ncbi:hypothetical protein [Streptomyces pseudovenezuelae]|uniref:hypothetical protein n=1 Tax=Streptomyces pseudovenezuelae TaxID=67350 RepID=UPI00371A423D
MVRRTSADDAPNVDGREVPDMGGGHAGRRGFARLPALCAVLFGLFLMHGSPASAAEGCHGSMPAPAPVTTGYDASPMTTAHAPATHHPGPAVQAAGAAGMSGALCVATPAHERIHLPAPGLLAIAAVTVPAAWTPARPGALGGSGLRGPPTGGRDHLLQACIART